MLGADREWNRVRLSLKNNQMTKCVFVSGVVGKTEHMI